MCVCVRALKYACVPFVYLRVSMSVFTVLCSRSAHHHHHQWIEPSPLPQAVAILDVPGLEPSTVELAQESLSLAGERPNLHPADACVWPCVHVRKSVFKV